MGEDTIMHTCSKTTRRGLMASVGAVALVLRIHGPAQAECGSFP
jgi:hypothetical protein